MTREQGPEHASVGGRGRRRVALDQQQALLVGVLQRAGGGPVSYGELRDAGIEYPASVVSELELAGLPLERCYEGPVSAGRLRGVRLDLGHISPDRASSREEPEPAPGPAWDGPEEVLARIDTSAAIAVLAERGHRALARLFDQARIASRAARDAMRAASPARAARDRARQALGLLSARAWRRSPSAPRMRPRRAPGAPRVTAGRRWLAPLALVAAAAVLAALVVGGLAGQGRGGGPPHAKASRTTSSAAGRVNAPSTPRPPPRRQPSVSVPATPLSPVLAALLGSRGHQLLEGGQAERAVPVLERALAATGETVRDCLEPESETCLSYAYALYDLGRALRLDRQPGAAVLILERRLQMANQRAAVRRELELARQEAGHQVASAPATG